MLRLSQSPKIEAVSFVGSSPIAKIVADKCRGLNKRVVALGGAKNHLVALPDADKEGTVRDVVASFAGASGQRCMAASVLLVVGENKEYDLISEVVERAKNLVLGTAAGELGPVIDASSKDKIISYIEDSEKSGAEVRRRAKRVAKEGSSMSLETAKKLAVATRIQYTRLPSKKLAVATRIQ